MSQIIEASITYYRAQREERNKKKKALITEGNNESTFETCYNILYGSTLVQYDQHPIQYNRKKKYVTFLRRSKV